MFLQRACAQGVVGASGGGGGAEASALVVAAEVAKGDSVWSLRLPDRVESGASSDVLHWLPRHSDFWMTSNAELI